MDPWKDPERSAQWDPGSMFSHWDWAFREVPTEKSRYKYTCPYGCNSQGPGQVYGEDTEKMREEKLTALEYEEGRTYKKRKKLDGRAHSRTV